MANKKISELQTRTPSLSDLILVGDPSNGFSYKCTVSALATIIETDIADGYVTLGTTQTISGAKTFSNNLTLTSVANASTDPDKFLVLNGSNVVNYRTGSEVLSDIGGQGTITLTTTGTSGAATFSANTLNIPQYQGVITLTTTGTSGAATLVGNTLNIPNYAPDLSGYVPTSRTITINGTTQDLTANRTYNVGTVTSVAASGGTGISISGSPITSSGTITITNTAPDQVVALTAGTGISISGTYPNFTITNSSPSLGGTVTSVALSAPTGFAVTGSPITSSGTLALAFASGYSLPTTASQTNWDSAYNNMIVSAAVTGTTTKTLTLTQQDAGTITASWTDDNTDAVTSVFGRTGAVVAVSGDYNTSQVTESTNLYFTDARARGALSAGTGISYSTTTGVIASTITQYTDAMARAAISLTTTGSSGSATYSNTTGILNIPTYTLAGLGGISLTSLSAFVPLSYNNTTGQFSIDKATTTADGYLSATDWTTFNNKQATITLTTTGTSGAATFTSNTLNIPQYQGALTLTTTGTSGAATLVGNTLNIPQYSGGSGSVSGTTNYIAKFTSSTAVGDSQLFDDGTNIGVGTATAGSKLQINGNAAIGYSTSTAATSNGLAVAGRVGIGTNTPSGGLQVSLTDVYNYFSSNSQAATLADVQGLAIGWNRSNGGGETILVYNKGAGSTGGLAFSNNDNGTYNERMRLTSAGSLGILTTTIGSTLQVNGNAAIGYSASTAASTNGLAVAGNVGIGNTTSAWGTAFRALQIGTGGSIYNWTGGNLGNVTISSNAYEDASLVSRYINTNGASSYLQNNGEHRWSYAASGTAGNAITYTVGMNLNTSGNLGIGTTTIGSRLQVNGNAAIGYSASTAAPTNGLMVAGNVGVNVTPSAWASGFRAIQIGARSAVYNSDINFTGLGNNIFYDGSFYRYITTAAISTIELGAGVITFGNAPSGTAGAIVSGTERMRIDASGNLGLGVVPSPWATTYVAQQLGTRASISNGPSGQTFLANNAYSTASNWVYLQTAAGTLYEQFAGGHTWYNVASGTAGTNITFTTQMNLNASGNLGINTTTIGSRLQVNGGAAIGYSASTAAPTNGLAVSGNVGVGTTTPGYTATSRQVVAINGGSAAGQGSILAFMQAGVNKGYVFSIVNDMEVWCESGTLTLGNNVAAPVVLKPNNTDRLTVTSGGQVTLATGANVSAIAQTGYSLTGSNAQSLIDLAGTWNTTGNPTAIKLNITNTASGANADLMELQVGGINQFIVTKAGAIQTSAPSGGTANTWKLGTVASVTPTSPNRTIEVEIGGTTYYLHAKTTNN